ncbi:MAG: AmmeMemoRadiSam system radical SAM enzyme [Candidatus Omnitrophota bacterium]
MRPFPERKRPHSFITAFSVMLKEALFFKRLDDGRVECFLCSHRCRIADGKFGICRVRQNKAGVLYTQAYGEVVAANVDPIEKKPLFHFLPGSQSFSIAAAGCNFRCGFCQNWQISQKEGFDRLGGASNVLSPQQIVTLAKKSACKSISYTYTEPTIYFEYALETSKLAKEEGLKNNFVTNGYMTKEALETIQPYLDAANVDLKFFKEISYRKQCGASLSPVRESIVWMRQLGIWVEVTTLVIPTLNDSAEELNQIARFLAGVGAEIPWHISRFYPQYKLISLEPTPLKILKLAYEIGKKAGLRYVYLGNVPPEGENTYCYHCGELLIERHGFNILQQRIKDSRCPSCQSIIDGIFNF